MTSSSGPWRDVSGCDTELKGTTTMGFVGIGWRWAIPFLIALAMLHGPAAVAADSTTREVQRLLWALGYGANRLDGVPSADTRTRASKFLTDRGKSPAMKDEQLLAELQSAYEQKRLKAQKPDSDGEVIDRRALTDTYPDGRVGRRRHRPGRLLQEDQSLSLVHFRAAKGVHGDLQRRLFRGESITGLDRHVGEVDGQHLRRHCE
jgi:hypothetical protein